MINSANSITVLGCGGSAGCPVLCCKCEICQSNNPKNKRMRTSAYLEWRNKKIVIDTGPDFKQQALLHKISRIDGVFYTHPHSDHVNGIDDLRSFCYAQKSVIPIFGNEVTIHNLMTRFSYCFLLPTQNWDKPILQANVLKLGKNKVLDFEIVIFELPHGNWSTVCYRFGNMAWMTDICEVTKEAVQDYLQGLDYLFLDCLMYHKVSSHLSVEEAFRYAEAIGAKQTYFLHMTHHIDYNTLSNECPANMYVAYDGMKILI